MFGRIAHRYDLMNTLMSLGMDAGWRRAAADAAQSPRRGRVLDVGTGTGKLALAVAESMQEGRVVGVDFAEPMLRTARVSLQSDLHGRRIMLSAADALRLPFPDEAFDAVVSAFVVRNLADVAAGMAEQARVLRTGGRLVVLEITPGPSSLIRPFFRMYFRGLVPLMGQLVAGDSQAYTYLPESAAVFLQPESVAASLHAAGLVDITITRLGLGSVAITAARKAQVKSANSGLTPA